MEIHQSVSRKKTNPVGTPVQLRRHIEHLSPKQKAIFDVVRRLNPPIKRAAIAARLKRPGNRLYPHDVAILRAFCANGLLIEERRVVESAGKGLEVIYELTPPALHALQAIQQSVLEAQRSQAEAERRAEVVHQLAAERQAEIEHQAAEAAEAERQAAKDAERLKRREERQAAALVTLPVNSPLNVAGQLRIAEPSKLSAADREHYRKLINQYKAKHQPRRWARWQLVFLLVMALAILVAVVVIVALLQR